VLAAFQATNTNYNNTSFIIDSDSKQLGIDNRATAFISGDITDFEGPLHDSPRVVRGFGGTRVRGVQMGVAIVRIEDDDGRVHRIRLRRSYYVPGSPDRLFSPQHFAQEMRRQGKGPAYETTDEDKCTLRWGKYVRTIPLDPDTNVATIRTAPDFAKFHAYCAEAGFDATDESTDPIAFDAALISDDEDDDDFTDSTRPRHPRHDNIATTWPTARGGKEDNLPWKDSQLPNTALQPARKLPAIVEQEELESRAEKDEAMLLEYHYKFSHAPFSKLQTMAKRGVIPTRLARCRVPVCAACMYGKATKRPWRTKQAANRDEAFQPTKPGQVVSVDQLKSPTPGFVAQLTGTLTNARYNYATVYVDAYSGWGHTYLQKTQNAAETLDSKKAFERLCEQNGIKVMHYHADNGVFRAKAWMDDCREKGQGMSFAGVDAHHQNGRAEARIRRLQELTRSTLLHAKRKWPQEISSHLWPYALRMANDSINATPSRKDPQERSPDQLFSGTEVETNPKHWIHFGSPVYVLEASLRGSTRVHHKWKERSKVGIYLGRSPQHMRSIALVLNPETGLVSPQFHVRHDGSFDTVKQLYAAGGTHISKWQLKAGLIVDTTAKTKETASQKVNETVNPEIGRPTQSEGAENISAQNEATPARNDAQEDGPADTHTEPEGDQSPTGENNASEQQPTRRERRRRTPGERTRSSSRTKRPVARLIEAMTSELRKLGGVTELFGYLALHPNKDTYEPTYPEVVAMKAHADPDSLYLHEARKQPDWKDFAEAMQLEIEQQVSTGLYTITKRSEVPEGATVLPAVWQLRRKRDVRTGRIKKHKARCNIDGSRMRYGEHYEQTYAPVAGWTAIRLVLAFILIMGWYAVTLDYVLAYPQAPAVRLLFMEIPKGFTLDGVTNPDDYVLQVNRNIYGGKDAGRTWFLYLKEKLETLGFKQSTYDDCLFCKGRMVYVLYTDDSILAGPDKDEIKRTIKQMKKVLDLTVEESLTDFLGVNIDRRDDGTIKLSQPRLIEQVIKDLHLEQDHTTTKPTPAASSKLLSRHEDDRPFDNHFNYRSVIGKLHYLVAGSRSEIAYAVHQCARFAQEPKMEHAKAVKWIGRYLKGTMYEGTILRPDRTKSLEVYVDADFAGNWDPEVASNIGDAEKRGKFGTLGLCVLSELKAMFASLFCLIRVKLA